MFENGWDFLSDVNKINLHDQAEELINDAVNLIEEKKVENKILKACEKGIYKKTADGYSGTAFKIPLKAVLLHKEGRQTIQLAYNRVKAELQKGERIVNTNLEELGITL
jgi:hypothetical protein